MQRVNLEFERKRLSAGWAGMALAVAGVVATAWVTGDYLDAARQVSVWEGKLAEVKRMSRRVPGVIGEPPRDARELQQEIRIANTVLEHIAVPWDALFRELETSFDDSVALLSMQPDARNRVVRIGGEAKDLQTLLDYTRRLDATGVISNVYLVGHEMKSQDPQRPVSFSLVAAWSESR
jgi:hypothetical protein